MTSASELFYNRRSRFGRSSGPFGVGSDFGATPHLDRRNRRHSRHSSPGGNNTRRNRIDSDGCDPFHWSQYHHRHPRQPPLHLPSHPPQVVDGGWARGLTHASYTEFRELNPNLIVVSFYNLTGVRGYFLIRRSLFASRDFRSKLKEHESTQVEDGGPQYFSGNASHSGSHVNVQDRLRVGGNNRLPGAVLLARERLLQRLRGITLSSSRRTSGNLYDSLHNDIAIGDDFRHVDAGDWETEISLQSLSTIVPSTDSVNHETSKRPPGLTQKALSRLCVEVFSFSEERGYEQQGLSMTIRECSICLESFSDGDELIRLPCGHRYHFCCLEPWVRTCGDCPYCRTGIDVKLHGVKEIPEC